MFSFVVVVFQILFVIMIGAFYRSSTYDGKNTQYVTFGLVTILGFVLMNSTYRKLSLFSLVLLIFISFLVIQANIIFMTFWSSCFTSFKKQVIIETNLLVNSVYGALGVIITCLDFIGLFEYWQVYTLLSFIMTIGYGLCSAIILQGLDTFDGGSGISVFLYSGVYSLMIWMICVRGKISILEHKKSQSYINYTLGFIGVAITLFSWPAFNIGGSMITYKNTGLSSNLSLGNSAYINTLCALGVSIIMSSFLSSHQTQSEKLKPKVFIDCFINSGIVVASFNDVSLHPVAGMTLALFSSVSIILIDKYLVIKTNVRNQSDFKMVLLKFSKILYRIIWSFFGVCVGAIVVKSRDSQSLWLLNDGSHGTKAGLMIAGWLIALVIGILFGIVSGLSVNRYMTFRICEQNAQKVITIIDDIFFDELESQIFPLYKDILQLQPNKVYQQDLTRRVLHQSLILQEKVASNIYETNKKQSSHETSQSVKVHKQTLVITNDFSKSNMDMKYMNLSAMKVTEEEQPVGEENFNVSREGHLNDQNGFIDYSPIHKLKARQSSVLPLRPAESTAGKPKELRAIPSSSRLVQIHLIQQESTDKNFLHKSEVEQSIIRKKLEYNEKVAEQDEIAGQNINRINS